jgi:hypothetical protein
MGITLVQNDFEWLVSAEMENEYIQGTPEFFARRHMGTRAYDRMKRVEKLERLRKKVDAGGSSDSYFTFNIGPTALAGIAWHERKPDGSIETTWIPEDPALIGQWPSDALIARVALLFGVTG